MAMHPTGEYQPQSRQSARLFLQSSELGPLTPSPAGECVPLPPPFGPGGTHSLAREGRGDKGTEDFRNTEAGNLVKVYSVLGYLNNDLMKYFENFQYK